MSFESQSKCWSGLYAVNVKVTVPDFGAYYKGEGPKVFLFVDSMQRVKLSGAEWSWREGLCAVMSDKSYSVGNKKREHPFSLLFLTFQLHILLLSISACNRQKVVCWGPSKELKGNRRIPLLSVPSRSAWVHLTAHQMMQLKHMALTD